MTQEVAHFRRHPGFAQQRPGPKPRNPLQPNIVHYMFFVMQSSWVYIVTNARNGTLYTGVTSNLEARIWEHRTGFRPGFSRKYGCKRLVWFETHGDIMEAIAREKRIKRWRRVWKLNLIEKENPEWVDLYSDLIGWVPDKPFRLSGMT